MVSAGSWGRCAATTTSLYAAGDGDEDDDDEEVIPGKMKVSEIKVSTATLVLYGLGDSIDTDPWILWMVTTGRVRSSRCELRWDL